jgi:hypothetical protein
MKKLVLTILALIVTSAHAHANDRLALAVAKHAACALAIEPWNGKGRITESFENEMRQCRRFAYSVFSFAIETKTDKLRAERIMSYVELEAPQKYRRQ